MVEHEWGGTWLSWQGKAKAGIAGGSEERLVIWHKFHCCKDRQYETNGHI
jgi:hypothetical protein